MLNLIILLFKSVFWKWPDPHWHLNTRLLIIMHGDVNQRQPKQNDQCYKIHGEWRMILAMTRGIRKTKMKEKYFNRGSKSTADYLCLFYQVSWLELLQKVKSIRCSTLQRQILVYCCLQPVQTLQLVVFHGAQSPSEIKRSHMQCSASWQSYLHITAKELLVLLVVVPNGKALCQDSCKWTLSSFIVTEKC